MRSFVSVCKFIPTSFSGRFILLLHKRNSVTLLAILVAMFGLAASNPDLLQLTQSLVDGVPIQVAEGTHGGIGG